MKKIFNLTPEKLYFTYPNTVAVICTKVNNKIFIMPAVWQIPLSHSPMIFGVLVSSKRYTHSQLLQSNNFSLNYFEFKYAKLIKKLGNCSGISVDKVKEFKIKLSQSLTIDSPILEDAYVSIECKETKKILFGDHDLFYGNVTNVWYDPSTFTNNITNKNTQPLLYIGNMVFTTTNKNKIWQEIKK